MASACRRTVAPGWGSLRCASGRWNSAVRAWSSRPYRKALGCWLGYPYPSMDRSRVPPTSDARQAVMSLRVLSIRLGERSNSVDQPLRVLVADDHPLFREGLRAMLTSVRDMEFVGEASTGEEAVSLADELQPDVVVMDIQMPGVGGIEATRTIVESNPHVQVLVVTMFEDDGTVFAAMRAGARGYVLKGANYREMIRAIGAIGSGEAIFSPAIAVRLTSYFTDVRPATAPQVFSEPAKPDWGRRWLGAKVSWKRSCGIWRHSW